MSKKKLKLGYKFHQRLWIKFLIKAVDEDISNQGVKCENKYCDKILPIKPRAHGWRRRILNGTKKWLCENCTPAYDNEQYCEFCYQLYIKDNLNPSSIDKKEWKQCESSKKCLRWVHKECLLKCHEINKSEISSKYLCCSCNELLRGKRKANIGRPKIKHIN